MRIFIDIGRFLSIIKFYIYLGAVLFVSTNSYAASKLFQVIQEFSDGFKRADTYWAHFYGVEEDLDKFGDYLSPEYFKRKKELYQKALNQLRQISLDSLSELDQRTYQLFKEDMEVSLKGFNYPFELIEFNQMDNRLRVFIDDSSETLTYFPFDTQKRYEAYLKRLQGFPAYVDRQIKTLGRGIFKNIVLNCVTAKKTLESFQEGLIQEVEKNPFYRPVLFMPKTFDQKVRAQLEKEFKSTIQTVILPGFKKFDRFFRQTYLPKCRTQYGIGNLPKGKDWYRYTVLAHTGVELGAQKIHLLGLEEVKRIAHEMEVVKKELGFTGDLKSFLKHMTTDPKYQFKSPDDLFNAFKTAKEKIEPIIPKYFSLIPKSDYKLVEAGNPEEAAASYKQPTDALAYGRFVINTKNMKATPLYGVTTLSMHEAVPGHHFQLALQFELKDELTEYQRKIYNSTAFVEGWALYAEYLGREMGLFKDPVQRFGNLNDEMLRAVRLVVDTGIHAKGWSRSQVLLFMKTYLASDEKDIQTEADRYSVLPGQALAYKLGQLKLIELRRWAEKELKEKFDVREFHKIAIGNGTVSLKLLETQVKAWVKKLNKNIVE